MKLGFLRMTWIPIALLLTLCVYLLWSLGPRSWRKKQSAPRKKRIYREHLLVRDESEMTAAVNAQQDSAAEVADQDHTSDDAFAVERPSLIFVDPDLRESVLGIEVSELAFDYQIANNLPVESMGEGMSPLHRLRERLSDEARNRCNFLLLLHATRRKEEFERQAFEFKTSCPSIDDDAWNQICEMGRDLDPESELFKTSSRNDEDAHQMLAWDDQRSGVERRMGDRRVARTAWLGKEQRKWQRRRDFRRHINQPEARVAAR